MKLSVIFEEKPARWGLRGDPYFWDYLKNLAENMEMLSLNELENWIKAEYLSLSGKELTDKYMDFAVIEQFAHGGMSSGGVANQWWVNTGIPLLKNRLTDLQAGVSERNNTRKTLIYYLSEHFQTAKALQDNYIEHSRGQVDIISENEQDDIEYAIQNGYDEAIFIEDLNKVVISDIKTGYTASYSISECYIES